MTREERQAIVRDMRKAENSLTQAERIQQEIENGDRQLENYRRAAAASPAPGYAGKSWDALYKEVYQERMDAYDAERQTDNLTVTSDDLDMLSGCGVNILGVLLLISAVILPFIIDESRFESVSLPMSPKILAPLACGLIGAIILAIGLSCNRAVSRRVERKQADARAKAETEAKRAAQAEVNEAKAKYSVEVAQANKNKKTYEDYAKRWTAEHDKHTQAMQQHLQQARGILDAYDIPNAFRSRDCVSELASMFDQQVVSTFQEAYGRLREEQKANDRFRIDQMNRQFQWEMEQDAQRERDRKLEDERRWQRDIDRMHREKLETAARDLAYEERRKADALEDIKKKLED